jgi:hypothetical protein
MSPEKQVGAEEPGSEPEAAIDASELHADAAETAEVKNSSEAQAKAESVGRPPDVPRRGEAKVEGKAKPKPKEEAQPVIAQPVVLHPAAPVTPPASAEKRSLASIMKVDLRHRKKRPY